MSGSVYTGTRNAAKARAGGAYLEVDGDVFDLAGEPIYDATTTNVENLEGPSGLVGFSETPKGGYVGARVFDAGNLTVAQIKAKRSSSVKLVLQSGKIVAGDGMWCTECSEVNAQEGTFTVRFDGPTVKEQVAS